MARKNSASKSPLQVDSTRHRDKRKNIPTEELRDFVRDDEQRPKDVQFPGLLYARDQSLDPQLVWKGKDEQDREPLIVPAVPIYIQEKLHPQALIEDIREQARRGKPRQADLFADFNGLPADFDQRVDFYNHEGNWANRFILGDSLLVMTSLAEKEGLKGKVQMIYLDPPYGIKFGSNWQVSTRKRDVKDGKAEDATRQPEQIRAFRDTWELGIHSYLAYWRDRLILSRELLTDTGSVFVQIGEENAHLVRCVLDEVLGAENYCAQIAFRKTTGKGSALLDNTYDILLWYAKNRETAKYRPTYLIRRPSDDDNYRFVETPDGRRRPLNEAELARVDSLPEDWRIFSPNPLTSQSASSTTLFDYAYAGEVYRPGKGGWKTNEEGMQKLQAADRLMGIGRTFRFIRYFNDFAYQTHNDIWDDTRQSGFGDPKVFVVQTMTRVIERCLLMTTDPGDLVLDPTCGSGTTAYVAEQWGRRWITIDTSRVALALARTRLMTAKFPYYLLSDSPEGVEKEAQLTGATPTTHPTGGDVRRGFVYKRVPHVTLKSIANNEEIDGIHAKWQEKLEPLRARLNRAFKANWEEWQIPREGQRADDRRQTAEEDRQKPPKGGITNGGQALLDEWWALRRERQREIDASIARHADTEMLFDQPYEDNKRIRVTGPFTVESLSPHRTISVAEKKGLAEKGKEGWTMKMVGAGQFGNIIIENLRKAGVQNTIKNERLVFDRLEVHAGVWVHATGEYTEKDGKSRRVAVCIGPEHGTVGPELVKEAAKEAVQGLGYDILIVCGFAFDPHVSEEAKRYGKLTVLPTRIHADLQMGDEFLKKTGAANLFTVFGEPDMAVTRDTEGKVVVEIKGLDIYDPTTGQVRNNSTDDIACWFIDTDYNGESFFVRHAYFTGADQPYDKLKRALRAEVDEAAWSALYSTASRPFDPPKSGRIAVKVINHYGDEVLKVFDLKRAPA